MPELSVGLIPGLKTTVGARGLVLQSPRFE